MKLRISMRDAFIVLATLFVTTALLVTYVAPKAGADHEPANKFAASASSIDAVEGETILLQERIRVSSPFDLGISLSAECAILTGLNTGGAFPDSSTATAGIEVWVEVDGRAVPVSTGDSDPNTDGVQTDDGSIVLCNRVYQRTVSDSEGDGEIDSQEDYIRTRMANGFNWLALDTGFNYDNPANGNNILDIVVKARYEEAVVGSGDTEALVGARSLVVEPTNASNHEAVLPADENAPPAP